MALISGSIVGEHKNGSPLRSHMIVHELIRQYGATTQVNGDEDYCVDIALLTGTDLIHGDVPVGVSPGPVARGSLRRFVIWHRLPVGMHEPESVRDWFVAVLPETERLVREHLPTKNRKYPAEPLADEVAGLREFLRQTDL